MELRNPIIGRRHDIEIAWKPTVEGWTTLNSNGLVLHDRSSAATGMVLRNNTGRVQYAITINLGTCSITRVEMRGAVEGMAVAWDLGIRKLEIQLDSNAAISILL
ncbi:Putative ribonuclease H protein At1g65750 [Linum perenne]